MEALSLKPLRTREIIRQNFRQDEDSARLLINAGSNGRAIRAISTLIFGHNEYLRISGISKFATHSETGGNPISALKDAADILVVDPNLSLENTSALRRKHPNLSIESGHYFLSEPNFRHLVIGPESCGCCFDGQYVDSLRAAFDLALLNTLLVLRFDALSFLHSEQRGGYSNLFKWMKNLGFEATWLLGTDNLKSYREILDPNENPKAHSYLSPFPDHSGSISDLTTAVIRAMSFSISQNPEMEGNINKYFNLYLVLQREAIPKRSVMRTVLREAINWEQARCKERRLQWVKQEGVVESLDRLRRFEALIPQLVANF